MGPKNLNVYPGSQDDPFLSGFTYFLQKRYRRQEFLLSLLSVQLALLSENRRVWQYHLEYEGR